MPKAELVQVVFLGFLALENFALLLYNSVALMERMLKLYEIALSRNMEAKHGDDVSKYQK